MSLYRYVESRDSMVRAMLDRALDALPVPDRWDDAVEEVVALFEALYGFLRRDAWIVRHLLGGHPGTGPYCTLMDRIAESMEGLGLDPGRAGAARRALLHRTFGEVLARSPGSGTGARVIRSIGARR